MNSTFRVHELSLCGALGKRSTWDRLIIKHLISNIIYFKFKFYAHAPHLIEIDSSKIIKSRTHKSHDIVLCFHHAKTLKGTMRSQGGDIYHYSIRAQRKMLAGKAKRTINTGTEK